VTLFNPINKLIKDHVYYVLPSPNMHAKASLSNSQNYMNKNQRYTYASHNDNT